MSITIPIDKMSTTERIQAMEDLWDALTHDTKEIDSPEWHKNILDNRRSKIKFGKATFLTIEDLKRQFRK
jgi:putative addiction module component (TIGR02574 family)